MYTPQKIDELKTKVRAFYHYNPLWKVTVLNQQWLCPYCSDIGAPLGKDENVINEIVTHFTTACKEWKEFQGNMLSLSELQEKAVALEVASLMRYEPLWQCFDNSGNWYCPYCAQMVPTDYGKEKQITPIILSTAQNHLLSCGVYKKGKGQPLRKEELLKILEKARLEEILIHKLRSYASSSDQRWFLSDNYGKWKCPHCQEVHESIDVSDRISRITTAPKLMAHHLIYFCEAFQKKQKLEDVVEAALPPKEKPTAFQGDVKEVGDRKVYILYPQGSIDLVSFPRLEASIDYIFNQRFKWILINLSAVDYINSTALGILIAVTTKCKERNGALVLCNIPQSLLVVLNTLSLDTVFKIFPDEELALEYIRIY